MTKRYFLPILSIILLGACVPEIKVDPPSAGNAGLQRPVILGGSTLAGYRDGALFAEGQKTGTGNMLLQAFTNATGIAYLNWEMAPGDGLGDNFGSIQNPFRGRGYLANVADCEGAVALGVSRIYYNWAEASALMDAPGPGFVPSNLAIPFATCYDMVDPALGNSPTFGGRNAYYPRLASSAGVSTIMSDAISLNPDFFVYWPGMEEMLNWATMGAEHNDPGTATAFETQLTANLHLLVDPGAKGILATIPDIDALPFFTTFPTDGLEIDSAKADSLNDLYAFPPFNEIQFHAGKNGFVIEDSTTASGYRLTRSSDRLLLTTPKDSIKCKKWGVVFTPLPDSVVLDSAELEIVNTRIQEFNQKIIAVAAQFDLPVVDMTGFYNMIKNGYREDGIDYSSLFVSGGFFSVDGLNPTAKGAALLANQFIMAINTKYQANIPTRVVTLQEGLRFP